MRHRRAADAALMRLLGQVPAVRVSGPRGCGKTTTCVAVVEGLGGTVVRLDDPAERAAVAADPSGYLRDVPRPVLIDEYHQVPTVLDVVKAELSRAAPGTVGQWILCGSVSIAAVTAAAESLGGRLVDLRMGTLSFDERQDLRRPTFLADVLEQPTSLRGWRPPRRRTRRELLDSAVLGGFPLVVGAPAARRRLIDAWVESSVVVDALSIGGIRDADALRLLLRRYAAATAQVMPKDAPTADTLTIGRDTVARYRDLLGHLHVIWQLPALVPGNARGQVTRSPKLHLCDSGLAAYLSGRDSEEALTRDPAAAGALVETSVVNDLRVQAATHDDPIRLHHVREDRHEVDLVVERGDGRLLGIEVKLSSNPGRRDVSGLLRLRESAGSRWLGGIVLARVPTGVLRDDGIVVAPLEAVWMW